jgi:hypothetical protein
MAVGCESRRKKRRTAAPSLGTYVEEAHDDRIRILQGTGTGAQSLGGTRDSPPILAKRVGMSSRDLRLELGRFESRWRERR